MKFLAILATASSLAFLDYAPGAAVEADQARHRAAPVQFCAFDNPFVDIYGDLHGVDEDGDLTGRAYVPCRYVDFFMNA